MINSKKQSFIVIGVFALVLMLGTVTYAFFNYTRTGTANTIRTGRISFNTTQSNTLNLTNVFPMSATDAGNANLNQVSVRIQGDTTYTDGEEYEISIVDVTNTIGSGNNAKTIPINYIASYTATPVQEGDPNIIGESSDDYFTDRGQSSAVYQLNTTGEATNGEQVLIGFIPKDIAIDGTLTIKAYLDSSKIAISDTYPTEETDTNNDGYIDGTPASFGEGKTVLTTGEWNSLQNTGTPLSFKIKAVSQEGTWVEEPTVALPTIASCPGCYFMYTENSYNFGTNGTLVENVTDAYSNDYSEIVSSSGKENFLGFTINNGKIERAFACGIKQENPNQGTPYCLEGSFDGSTAETNIAIIASIFGVKENHSDLDYQEVDYGCSIYNSNNGTKYDCSYWSIDTNEPTLIIENQRFIRVNASDMYSDSGCDVSTGNINYMSCSSE